MEYIRATVAYDGTDFRGFQLQASGRTVQGELEAALLQLSGTETRVIGSGRTDAGVHALGQVVGFHLNWRHTLPDLQRALNAVLPPDVAIVNLSAAHEGWHPRFSAKWRHYRYTVLNSPVRSPLERRYTHLVTKPLDLDLLQAAATVFVGEHDFASFGQPMQEGETTVRAILHAAWQGIDHFLVCDVIGNAFLRGMVRALVGSMLRVGSGELKLGQLAEALTERNRAAAPAPPAPACGLCLTHVEYNVLSDAN